MTSRSKYKGEVNLGTFCFFFFLSKLNPFLSLPSVATDDMEHF